MKTRTKKLPPSSLEPDMFIDYNFNDIIHNYPTGMRKGTPLDGTVKKVFEDSHGKPLVLLRGGRVLRFKPGVKVTVKPPKGKTRGTGLIGDPAVKTTFFNGVSIS